MTKKKRASRAGTISAADWVAASRKRLIAEGISSVKVEPLARELGVTPGSFYWHFKNRQSLHRALLRDWLNSNVKPFFSTFELAEKSPREQYLALAYVWVLSPDFNPGLDVAIREWSKTSSLVGRIMRRVDVSRIGLYQGIFEDFGHEPIAALVRARMMYYHQIGYYTMKVEEDLASRLMHLPHYAAAMSGDTWLLDCTKPEEVRAALTGFRHRVNVGAVQACRKAP
ncbi:TetR/AcrR family transcriptional regulator [Granulosicoccus antarcticus]|uniref:HTH tetR-type domain-containing protein n=1 Tax=Granulosicoccus antarcticus IMCC3135 TaxID=1192854 RepID=A0A2Z2NVW1_9GAMM|nr:TetR/AcrR family transcriptional regulator [Granulosicoccus antarcticus]ASJ75479.1 hypothetical protein IMCC3135_27120 [Granulosicoccus antarcticus IMCC3135]